MCIRDSIMLEVLPEKPVPDEKLVPEVKDGDEIVELIDEDPDQLLKGASDELLLQ